MKKLSDIIPKEIAFPFILLSTCFAMWGLSNNMTDPLVAAFRGIFGDLSNAQTALIQNAFYGAYFCLGIPGAIIARKFGYKKGILAGLGMYIIGGLLFYPASMMLQFEPFLIAFFVLAGGLSILETNANPYIIAMGPEDTATQRLNIAQSFNPVGSLIGLFVCKFAILTKLDVLKEQKVDDLSADALLAIQKNELEVVMTPYFIAALVLIVLWVIIAAYKKMPVVEEEDSKAHLGATLKRLVTNKNYVFAVIAQFFYVGAQIAVWTYTIHYITGQLGISNSEAMNYHVGAIITFSVARWVFTGLMRIFKPSILLVAASVLGVIMTCSVMFVQGIVGVYSLIIISACMSLMFPTIFGLGSRGLGEDTKIGASGLIMAILGGALLTLLQGNLIDVFGGENAEMLGAATAKSYVVPLVCFVVISLFGVYSYKTDKPQEV